jgi:hypothetical protein
MPELHRRLANEAAMQATEQLLAELPAEYSPALEHSIYQAVHDAIRYYADGQERMRRQLQPLSQGRARA